MGLVTRRSYINDGGSYIDVSLSAAARDVVRIGVDIGQVHDYTALVVTQEERRPKGKDLYLVRHIERVPLGTSFPSIAERIKDVMRNLAQLREERQESEGHGFRIELLIDATGVGRPVIDLVRQCGLRPISVTLTGGDALTERDGGEVSMAKRWMVGRLQVLLQSDRLVLPATPEGDLLARELSDYRMDYTPAGNTTFNARTAQHDDLVIALGLSTGTGARRTPAKPLIAGVMHRRRS